MNIEHIKKLIEFDTPTVANGLGMLGVRDDSYGYTGPDIRALMPEFGTRVGIAATARLDTTSPGTEKSENLFTEWVHLSQEVASGDGTQSIPVFALIESVGLRPRYTVTLGEGMGTRLKTAGVVGFLTNGCIRDIGGLRQVGLACWGVGLSPMHGQMRWLDVNSPIVIDGMTVHPGDVVHADENGAIVIPREVADQVYDKAVAVQEAEQAMFTKWNQRE